MIRTKQHVDKHVSSILGRLRDEKERQSRGYQIAKLYYEVKEYELAKRYLLGYMTVKENLAAPHKLLGSVHEALHDYQKAVASYKRSLELDPQQKQLVLKICEMYNKVDVDPERAKYWVEKAEKIYPCSDIVLNLREKIYANTQHDGNCEELEHLLSTELKKNPHDSRIRERLLRLYLEMGNVNRAYTHAMEVEKKSPHTTSSDWYKCLLDVLQIYQQESGEVVNGTFHKQLLSAYNYYLHIIMQTASAAECAELLYKFDQCLYNCATMGESDSEWQAVYSEMCAQMLYHAGTLLLKRAQQEQQGWSRATTMSGVLYLYSVATPGLTLNTAAWYNKANKQDQAVYDRMHGVSHLRFSQAGHMLKHLQDADSREWCATVTSDYSTIQGREKLYSALFPLRHMKDGKSSSYLMKNDMMNTAKPSIPTVGLRQAADKVMYEHRGDSLHLLVWTAMQYFSVDDKLQPDYDMQIYKKLQYTCQALTNALPETLCQLDVESFLYACVYCAVHHAAELRLTSASVNTSKPSVLPASITKPLCTSEQTKWWNAAYALYKNTAKENLGQMRLELRRGLEEVRLIEGSMELPLLANLARTFTERANTAKAQNLVDKSAALHTRAIHYWQAVVKAIEKNTSSFRKNALFTCHTSATLSSGGGAGAGGLSRSERSALLEEGFMILADDHMSKGSDEEALDLYARVSSAEAAFKQARIYHKLSDESFNATDTDQDTNNKQQILLTKARDALYNCMDRTQGHPGHPLAPQIANELDAIESKLSNIELDASDAQNGDLSASSIHTPLRTPAMSFRGPARFSTPNPNGGGLNTSGKDYSYLAPSHSRPTPERLEAQVRSLAFTQDVMVRQVMERNDALVDQNTAILEEVKQNRTLLERLQNAIEGIEKSQAVLVGDSTTLTAELIEVKTASESAAKAATAASEVAAKAATAASEAAAKAATAAREAAAKAVAVVSQSATSTSASSALPAGISASAAAALPVLTALAQASAVTATTATGLDSPANRGLQAQRPATLPSYMLGGQQYSTPTPTSQPSSAFGPQASAAAYRPEYDPYLQHAIALGIYPPPPGVGAPPPLSHHLYGSQQAAAAATYPHLHLPTASTYPGFMPPNSQAATYRMPGLAYRATTPQDFQTGDDESTENSDGLDGAIYGGYESQTLQDWQYSTALAGQDTSSKPASYSTSQMPPSILTTTTTISSLTGQAGPTPPLQSLKQMLNAAPPAPAMPGPGFFSTPDKITSQPNPALQNTSNTSLGGSGSLFKSPAASGGVNVSGTSDFPITFKTISSIGGTTPTTTSVLKTPSSAAANTSKQRQESEGGDSYVEADDSYQGPDFTPVIPLPAEVEVVTGEEDEQVLFCARAKLFRFVETEWKERGIGNMKVLFNSDTHQARVVMRREQVLKVCANHYITASTNMKINESKPTMLTWQAMDFSDGESTMESFCCRFKTEELCSEFKAKVEKAKEMIAEKKETTSSAKPAASSAGTKILAEKFKPKEGTWECEVCLINNDGDTVKCQACGTVKPGAVIVEESSKPTVSTSFGASGGLTFGPTASFSGFSFGSKPATSTESKTTEAPAATSSGFSGFNFGPSSTAVTATTASTATFSSTPASDSLKSLVQKAEAESTSLATSKATPFAANTLGGFTFTKQPIVIAPQTDDTKDADKSVSKEPTKTTANNPFATFSFTNSSKPGTTSASTSLFSTPKTTQSLFGTPAQTTQSLFGTPSTTSLFSTPTTTKPFSLTTLASSTPVFGSGAGLLSTPASTTPVFGSSPSLMTTPATTNSIFGSGSSSVTAPASSASVFGSGSGTTVGFGSLSTPSGNKDGIFGSTGKESSFSVGGQLFKSKTPDTEAAKSSDKSLAKDNKDTPSKADGEDANEHDTSEYEPDVDFKPVIPLPDLVELKTGEEDEITLFEERAKLYRHDTTDGQSQWKERGAGKLKIMKHEDTGRIRILMRRDQVLKLCANHVISATTELKPMSSSDKAYCWIAQDYSEGEMSEEQLCAKFKNVETAEKFKKIFKEAPAGAAAEAQVVSKDKPDDSAKSGDKKQGKTVGFGDMFKPKAGSWECSMCYVSNDGSEDYCAACQSPKPGVDPKPKDDFKPTTGSNQVSFGKAGGFTVASLGGSSASGSFSFSSFGQTAKTDSKDKTSGEKETEKTTSDSDKPAPFSFGSGSSGQWSFNFGGESSKTSTPVKAKEVTSPQSPTSPQYYVNSEDNEPSVEFTPVIDLPDKIEVVTGEEDELLLYSHQAKLYRFSGTDWKERGVGELKILQHKTTLRVRCLMRRDQVLKTCLNHYLTADLALKPMHNSQGKAWVWFADDFSDGEMNHEKFAVRFKNADIASEFKSAFEKAQSWDGTELGEEMKSEKDATSESGAKSDTTKTFAFKSENIFTSPIKDSSPSKPFVFGGAQNSTAGGSLTFNTTVTPPTKDQTAKSLFGSSVASTSASVFGSSAYATPTSVFGSIGGASPLNKSGSDQGDSLLRQLLQSPATDATSLQLSKEAARDDGSEDDVIFVSEDQPTLEQKALAHKYQLPENFYLYLNKPDCPGCIGCEDWEEKKDKIIAASPKQETREKAKPQPEKHDDEDKPADTSAPFSGFSGTASFASLVGSSSGLAFAPKQEGFSWQGSGQALFGGSSKSKTGDGADDDAAANVEAEPDIHFEPVVPLPELVETKTGEEDEELVYSHRCKLYRFTNNQWKERGVGDVKILRQPQTGSVRLLMRREQVLKVACNHAITKDMALKPMATSETSWCWFATDYSEYEPTQEQFAIKFKNKEIALEFKSKFEECQESLNVVKAPASPLVTASPTTATAPAQQQQQKEDAEDYAGNGDDEDGYEDVSDDEDEDELRTFFEKRATLYYASPQGKWEKIAMGDLCIVYDEDVMGFRIQMYDHDGELVCNHIICESYAVHSNEKHRFCEWQAKDYSTDEPVRRTFKVEFSSVPALQEYVSIFNQGVQEAIESGICERTEQSRELYVS